MPKTDMRAVICLSTQYWSDLHTNKQHLMSRLAARGFPVLYVEPAAHDVPSDRTLAMTPLRMLYPTPTVRRQEANLWIYSHALLPLRRYAMVRSFNRRQEDVVLPKTLRRIASRRGWEKPLLWFYRPEAVSILPAFPGSPVLYDCVDDYASFPSYHRAELLTRLIGREARLVKAADVMIVTSPRLGEIFGGRARHLKLVGNVADYDFFAQAPAGEHPLWKGARGRRLIFAGAINALKVDVASLLALAQKLPDDTLLLTGPLRGNPDDWAELERLPNVRLSGEVPYTELPVLMHGADVALIPYNLTQLTASIFPMKFYEYMAAGLPVVASRLPALTSCEDSDLTYFYDDIAGMVNAVERATADKLAGRERRQARARNHTWESRLEQILEELAAAGVEML
jgi:glycosyltransferase involved in cell wall biosynthesis